MEKKTKYDTNPLDPDFVRRTEEVRARTSDVGKAGATEEQTRRINSGDVDKEAPTRYYPQPSQYDSQSQYASQAEYNSQAQQTRYASQAQYDDAGPTSYPSIFIPPTYQPPQNYQGAMSHASAATYKQAPTSRTLPGIGIPENLAMILPYLPFPLVGAVPGIVELLLIPRTETRTRFHAAQGLALHLMVLIIGTLFSTADSISSILRGPFHFMLALASTLFTIAATVFFIISMIRVWKGEPHTVSLLAEATRWLNEKLAPRK